MRWRGGTGKLDSRLDPRTEAITNGLQDDAFGREENELISTFISTFISGPELPNRMWYEISARDQGHSRSYRFRECVRRMKNSMHVCAPHSPYSIVYTHFDAVQ